MREVKELAKEWKDETPESDPANDDEDLEYDSSTDEYEEQVETQGRNLTDGQLSQQESWKKSQNKPQTFNVEVDRSFSLSENMNMKCRGLLRHSSNVERYRSLKREVVL